MSTNYKVKGSAIAFSRLKQDAVGTAAALSALLDADENSTIGVVEERTSNIDRAVGEVEATDVELADVSTAEATLNLSKAVPDAIAWAFTMGFGDHYAASANGAYEHTMQLATYSPEPYYFTLAQRRGAKPPEGPASLQRFVGMAVNTLGITANRGEGFDLALGVVGTGQFDDGVFTEVIQGLGTATTLTLANKVKDEDHTHVTVWCSDNDSTGDDAQYQHKVATVSVVNTTKTLTITPPLVGATNVNYRVSYPVDTTETGYAWTDLGALALPVEFRIRASDLALLIGPEISFSGATPNVPTMTGGVQADCPVESFNYELNRNATAVSCWRASESVPYATTRSAKGVDLGDIVQTVRLNRRVQDYLFKQHWDANTHFGLRVQALGPAVGTTNYKLEICIPRLKFLTKPYAVSDKYWIEEGNLVALKRAGTSDPTAWVKITNGVATYGA